MIDLPYVTSSLRPTRQPRLPWGRVNSLIDGVFGFSATVLMLRLGTPVFEEGGLGAALTEQAPYYLLYAVGFVQIVGTWSVLRRLSQWSIGLDFYAMLLAFSTLMMWATIPFTVDVLAESIGNDDDMAAAVRLMATTLLVGMVAYTALFWRLEKCGWFREDLDQRVFAVARLVSYTVVAWPATTLLLTFVSPWAALLVYAGSVVLSLIPLEAMTTEQYEEFR